MFKVGDRVVYFGYAATVRDVLTLNCVDIERDDMQGYFTVHEAELTLPE